VNFKPRRMEEPEINVVSLIDVVLMLVVFFMLSSSFVGEGRLRIQLPSASSVPLTIAVTANDAYLVNNRELINGSADTLRAAITQVVGEDRTGQVSIKADGRASHQSVVTAMDVLGKLGYTQLNILTTHSSGTETP